MKKGTFAKITIFDDFSRLCRTKRIFVITNSSIYTQNLQVIPQILFYFIQDCFCHLDHDHKEKKIKMVWSCNKINRHGKDLSPGNGKWHKKKRATEEDMAR